MWTKITNHMTSNCVKSVEGFIKEVNDTLKSWHEIDPRLTVAWFRGDRCKNNKLLPKLFDRLTYPNVKNTFENDIMQEFRMRAPVLHIRTPPYERIDEWLFLARHNDLLTRLLDWTEGALFALFFAINEIVSGEKLATQSQDSPVVWMLNPIMFNFVASGRMFLPLSWNSRSNLYHKRSGDLALRHATNPKDREKAEKQEGDFIWFACPSNIYAAFALSGFKYAERYPIALKPQHIHPRVTAQRSCFTVHGKDNRGIEEFFKDWKISDLINVHNKAIRYEINREEFEGIEEVLKKIRQKHKKFNELFLKKIMISPNKEILIEMVNMLRSLGISHSTLYPDLTGLAKELNFSNPKTWPPRSQTVFVI